MLGLLLLSLPPHPRRRAAPADDPRLAQYRRMLLMRLPRGMVEAQMRADGLDPATGERLHLTFEASGAGVTQRAFSQRFVDEMRRLGIDVDVVVNTFPQLTEKMRNKQYQVAGLAWGFDYPDAQNILQLLYGPNGSPGINRTNFKNAEFDALYEEAALLQDGPERTRLYERMAAIIGREVPVITRDLASCLNRLGEASAM